MKIMSAKKYLIGAFVLPFLFSGTVSAESVNMPEAYGADDQGVVWRSSSDLGNHCWRTGYWTPAMAIAECDPDLVEQPEVAKAEPAPAPAPTAPKKVTFSADALFDFDSAQLKPAGIQALDEFAKGIEGVQYDLITATGHADRIGNSDYNKRLSVRRAESVKNHLVSKGIDASRIYADGVGEAGSETGDSCNGMSGQALKDCLAPDRRVDIEVSGLN